MKMEDLVEKMNLKKQRVILRLYSKEKEATYPGYKPIEADGLFDEESVNYILNDVFYFPEATGGGEFITAFSISHLDGSYFVKKDIKNLYITALCAPTLDFTIKEEFTDN